MGYEQIIHQSGILPDIPVGNITSTTPQPQTTTSTTTTTYPTGSGSSPVGSSHSIMPASGYWGTVWPATGAMPQSLSVGGWTVNGSGYHRGFKHQTFLGASIRSFSMNGGFGDSSSTLNVELVNDEYNVSDKQGKGGGDDVYHNGVHDLFAPPMVGSPVFFKFGQNFATVEEAYRKTYDDLYDQMTFTANSAPSRAGMYNRDAFTTLADGQYVNLEEATFSAGADDRKNMVMAPILDFTDSMTNKSRGKYHLVFGGILQTYTQNRGPGGNPLYSVQVTDPREILANTSLILNNYTGTVYDNQNLLNIYGFLEHNLSLAQTTMISGECPTYRPLTKIIDINRQITTGSGAVSFKYDDTYRTPLWDAYRELPPLEANATFLDRQARANLRYAALASAPTAGRASFPITGTGFSRRGPQGIPYYRVKQAIETLMGLNGKLPQEYKNRGFGGRINFRGFNYVVDFSNLPNVPGLYYLDFDQISILDLALEVCDVVSQDLFVTLLPVIKDHPACKVIYDWNTMHQGTGADDNKKDMIAGIIKLNAIDRSSPPKYGAIKSYIDGLAMSGIYVENQDLGFELSNVVTDKFITGAQEVDIHYFSTNNDREALVDKAKKLAATRTLSPDAIKPGYKWSLECALAQQVLPYYGMLGNHAVTIPKGFGAYQQILLDASSLSANGVGAYYVATELELRCAMISYERWVDFLQLYNDKYVESIESDDAAEIATISSNPKPNGGGVDPPIFNLSNNYAVTVPRSVFNTYTPAASGFNKDKLPWSPCNPPYGYPLYYKRMTKIGCPEGGLTDIFTRWQTVLTNYAEFKSTDNDNYKAVIGSQLESMRQLAENTPLSTFEKAYYDALETLMFTKNPVPGDITQTMAFIEPMIESQHRAFAILPKVAKKNIENAKRVYDFVKNVAEDCLGKKFLVKLPKEVNLSYKNLITYKNAQIGEYGEGPFGFKPRPTTSGVGDEFKNAFIAAMRAERSPYNTMEAFLSSGTLANPNTSSTNQTYTGACNVNFNPISDQYECNYTPTDHGGFFPFDLYPNVFSNSVNMLIKNSGYNLLPTGVQQMLIPYDATNFINDNGRICSYVRFDNSEHLSFEGFNKDDLVQQTYTVAGMIPDLSYDLENVKGDIFHAFPAFETAPETSGNVIPDIPKQVAFVKCSVSDKIFMPPKVSGISLSVFAQTTQEIKTKSKSRKIFIPCSGLDIAGTTLIPGSGVFVDSFRYYTAHYVPLPDPGESVTVMDFNRKYEPMLGHDVINTDLEQLNTDHVYALITLPSRVIPTKDARLRDATFQNINSEIFKHLMTMDTVLGPKGFDKPLALKGPQTSILKTFDPHCKFLNADSRVNAWLASKKAIQNLNFGFPKQINASCPSPIYPDLVALPLMSKDRCYGPWVSSLIDGQAKLFANIGGKVEFIKDENLAPWNYAGYTLLNAAGRLKAEFSNSLLLFSERGGFSVPSAPSGVSLGVALMGAGPIITNISIDVSEAGIKTTYKLDLYTSSFGKLQKQQQDKIAKMGREKQKITDERNALIRKGLGKNAKRENYIDNYNAMTSSPMLMRGLDNVRPMTDICMSVTPKSTNSWSSQLPAGVGTNPTHVANYWHVDGSLQSIDMIGSTAQSFLDNRSLSAAYYNASNISFSEMYKPASEDSFHANMAYVPNPQIAAKAILSRTDGTPYSEANITRYGVS